MPRLLIKQRVFSWSDTYDVYGEDESPRYFVKAEFLSLTHQIHVYDSRTGEELGAVREAFLTLMPRFEIEIGGRIMGQVEKRFTLFRPQYEVDFNGWRVEGDFLGWDYGIYSECSAIMHIEKEFLHWGDTYVLQYDDPEDELLGLMLVIAIDAANCSNG